MTPSKGWRGAGRRAVLKLVPPARRAVEQRDEATRAVGRWRQKASTLQERIDQLNGELAQARLAADGADSRSAELNFVFIVTYGRSGSTLLQGILCSIPGYDIKGENGAALHELFAYHRRLAENRAKFVDRKRVLDSRHPFYGVDQYAVTAAFDYLRHLVVQTLLQPAPGTRVTGYKEIRWQHEDWREYLTFLQHVFPGAKFVINTRNHESVSQSRWWAERKNPLQRLERYERQFDNIEEFLGDQAYRVHFDDYVADHDVLRGLFDWLGEEFDPDTIAQVMNTKHSIGEGPEHLRKEKN